MIRSIFSVTIFPVLDEREIGRGLSDDATRRLRHRYQIDAMQCTKPTVIARRDEDFAMRRESAKLLCRASWLVIGDIVLDTLLIGKITQ
jgi:hypothetical protein